MEDDVIHLADGREVEFYHGGNGDFVVTTMTGIGYRQQGQWRTRSWAAPPVELRREAARLAHDQQWQALDLLLALTGAVG